MDITEVIKGKVETGTAFRFSLILSTVQVALAMLLIIFSMTVNKQILFMQNFDKGISTKNIISLPTKNYPNYKVDPIRQELIKNPNILNVGVLDRNIHNFGYQRSDVGWEGMAEDDKFPFSVMSADYYAQEMIGLDVIQGRFFSKDLNVDDYFDNKYFGKVEYVINETAQKLMGIDNPIGLKIWFDKNKDYSEGYIVGIIKDFHFQSLRNEIPPLIMVYNPEAMPDMLVKISDANQSETLDYIDKIVSKIAYTDVPFTYSFISDGSDAVYDKERSIKNLTLLFAVTALFLSLSGFIGINAYFISQEKRNITVHKVLGASAPSLIEYYCKKRIKIYIMPAIIAMVLGWYLIDKWLQSYAYHISMPYWVFALVFTLFFASLIAIVATIVNSTASKTSTKFLRK